MVSAAAELPESGSWITDAASSQISGKPVFLRTQAFFAK